MRRHPSGTSSRTAMILIDGSNLHAACRALGFNVDYKKLLDSFEGTVVRAYYFTALPPESEQSTLRPMVDYLEFNGYTIITKTYKEFNQSNSFVCKECNAPNTLHSVKTKGNMDIELSVIAMEMASYCDDTVIFSGDGDFRFLVEALQRGYGHKVTVVSTIKTSPMLCADALRRQADTFIDLSDMREAIERTEDAKSRARRNFLRS